MVNSHLSLKTTYCFWGIYSLPKPYANEEIMELHRTSLKRKMPLHHISFSHLPALQIFTVYFRWHFACLSILSYNIMFLCFLWAGFHVKPGVQYKLMVADAASFFFSFFLLRCCGLFMLLVFSFVWQFKSKPKASVKSQIPCLMQTAVIWCDATNRNLFFL